MNTRRRAHRIQRLVDQHRTAGRLRRDAAQWRATEDSKPAAIGAADRVLNVSCSSPSGRAAIGIATRAPFGHVGRVTDVRRVSGKIFVDIDMNGGSWVNAAEGITTDFDEFNNRTREWTAAVNWRFIQATR